MFNLGAFLSYVFVATFTPGPNNIMSMANASKYGYKKTFKFTLGVAFGYFIVLILCSYFNLLLFKLVPRIKIFMGLLGAGYMIYLAIKIMKSTEYRDNIEDENLTGESKLHNLNGNRENLKSFFTGVTMQFVNPKGILYGITVLSNFIMPFYKSSISLILFSVFLAFLALLSTSCWALCGSLFNRFLSRYSKPFSIAMGLLLIYSAFSISGITQLLH